MGTRLGSVVVRGIVAVACGLACAPAAEACTRVLLNKDPAMMVAARTMDLYRDDQARLAFFPRGLERRGAAVPEAAKWKSKYASVGVLGLDAGMTDGLNEKGLAAHLLYLEVSEHEPADARPVVSNLQWAHYVLDNFASVEEALAALAKVRIAQREAGGRVWPLHLAIEDATGDSAIIEYVKGKAVVHHGKEFTVMTNDPPFDQQLANVKQYKLFGGTLPLPGDIDPASRFVRVAAYMKTLPKPASRDEAVAFVASAIRTAQVPFGAEDSSGSAAEDKWPTLWLTATDLTGKRLFFQNTRSPSVIWVQLERLSSEKRILALSPSNPELAGDVTRLLKPFATKGQFPPAF